MRKRRLFVLDALRLICRFFLLGGIWFRSMNGLGIGWMRLLVLGSGFSFFASFFCVSLFALPPPGAGSLAAFFVKLVFVSVY